MFIIIAAHSHHAVNSLPINTLKAAVPVGAQTRTESLHPVNFSAATFLLVVFPEIIGDFNNASFPSPNQDRPLLHIFTTTAAMVR